MNTFVKLLSLPVIGWLCCTPAQAYHYWVASNGSDAASCTRESPCATFAKAISLFDNSGVYGGEVTCVDSGHYGGATIAHSVTINCEGVIGSNQVDTVSAGQYSISLAATDIVILKGLDLDMDQAVSGNALNFTGAGTLILDHVKVSNASVVANLSGISFTPSGAGRLVIKDSTILNNGKAGTGAGLLVKPTSGGTAQVTVERTNVSANVFGIAADGSNSTGGINMTIKDCVFASNINDGVVATTQNGAAPIGILISNSALTNNGFGTRAIGVNVTVRVDSSKIIGNSTGVSALSGGAMLSVGNNIVQANGVNGAFTGQVLLN